MEKTRITSAQNSKLKNAIRLQTSRGRSKQRRIVIYGHREIQRAVGRVKILELFVDEAARDQSDVERLLNEPELFDPGSSSTAEWYELPKELFRRLAYGDRTDGVVAVAEWPETQLDDISVNESSLIVIVQGIEKPGNLGAIFRSADGAGVDALLVADPMTTPFHPNSIRSSLGTVFSIPNASATTVELKGWLDRHQFRTCCAHPEAAIDFSQADLTGRVAMVFGNEAKGLSNEWLSEEFDRIKLPMLGIADSLNVSVSAAVLMYEARRQRTQ